VQTDFRGEPASMGPDEKAAPASSDRGVQGSKRKFGFHILLNNRYLQFPRIERMVRSQG